MSLEPSLFPKTMYKCWEQNRHVTILDTCTLLAHLPQHFVIRVSYCDHWTSICHGLCVGNCQLLLQMTSPPKPGCVLIKLGRTFHMTHLDNCLNGSSLLHNKVK